MNINEVQKTNSENQTQVNYSNYKKGDNNFSYYVEVSKTQEAKNIPAENINLGI